MLRPIFMQVRRWLVPAAVAVVVLALVAGGWLLRGSGAGAGSDAASGGPASVPPHPISPHPSLPGRSTAVSLTGYHTEGTRLRIYYATGLPSCYGHIQHPQVDQGASAVTVTIRLKPVRSTKMQVCPDIAVIKSVVVALAAPLGGRTVIDGNTGQQIPRFSGIPGQLPVS
jgi:hypothetical protein